MRPILLDAHAPAAAVALLAPPQLTVQELAIERHTRGQAADERHESLAVALGRL